MRKNICQEKIFLAGEGDCYFERNNGRILTSPESGPKIYQKHIKKGSKILEIGCSQGANLKTLLDACACVCYGIDPSRKAIRCGKKTFPDLHLSVGVANHLDFPDNFFDCVIFGFCLYLVDRSSLARVVSESDRVLKNKGFMGITDFDTKYPRKRVYKHCAGVMSYKMNYESLFLAFPHYTLVEKRAFTHTSSSFCQDPKERLCSVVLFKDHENAYTDEKDA